ncbi:hypothetical protein D3C71_2005270 [compost metagenome]
MHIAAWTESLRIRLFHGFRSQFFIYCRLWLLKHGGTFLLLYGYEYSDLSVGRLESFSKGLISIVADFGGACMLRIS